MIRNFGDHASNERTFLAWVRTAIAVMAFGFIIERFDLFLKAAARQGAGGPSAGGQQFANFAGLAFIVLGTIMVVVAAARLFVPGKKIDSENSHAGAGTELDIALAALLALLGGSLFLYLAHAVLAWL
jgi:putative membrane protein